MTSKSNSIGQMGLKMRVHAFDSIGVPRVCQYSSKSKWVGYENPTFCTISRGMTHIRTSKAGFSHFRVRPMPPFRAIFHPSWNENTRRPLDDVNHKRNIKLLTCPYDISREIQHKICCHH